MNFATVPHAGRNPDSERTKVRGHKNSGERLAEKNRAAEAAALHGGTRNRKDYASGIFSRAPTIMRSLLKLLAALSALTVVPFFLAMRIRVSPDLTT